MKPYAGPGTPTNPLPITTNACAVRKHARCPGPTVTTSYRDRDRTMHCVCPCHGEGRR